MAFNATTDPNATLRNIRRIVASMDDLETARSLDAYAELAEITDDLANLDNHLTNGGDLPKDWQHVKEHRETHEIVVTLHLSDQEFRAGLAHRITKDLTTNSDTASGEWQTSWRYDNETHRWIVTIKRPKDD